MKVHFCTFGNEPRFSRTLAKLLQEARSSGFFDSVRKFNQYDLKADKKLLDFMSSTRGYGFWTWKPLVIAEMMLTYELGDVIVYADAGCGISTTLEARQAFGEWINQVAQHPVHRLGFQMTIPEEEYTKADVFEALGCSRTEYKESGQYIATILVMMNTLENRKFVAEWMKFCVQDNFCLAKDVPSKIPNPKVFKAHRHDQSILSLLLKKYGAAQFTDRWMNPSYPIMALRRREKMDFLQRCTYLLSKVRRLLPLPKFSGKTASDAIPVVFDRMIASLEAGNPNTLLAHH